MIYFDKVSTFYWNAHVELFPRSIKWGKKKPHTIIYFIETHFCKNTVTKWQHTCMSVYLHGKVVAKEMGIPMKHVQSVLSARKASRAKGDFQFEAMYISFQYFFLI